MDRLPVDLWCTPEVEESLKLHTGATTTLDLFRALGLDKIVWVFPEYRGHAGRTTWGAPVSKVRAGQASYEEITTAPLAGREDPAILDDYPFWPDPDRFDFAAAVSRAEEAHRDFAVIGPWIALFEVYSQLRGLEQSFLDLALAPDFVETVLDRVEEIQTEMLERFFAAGGADVLDFVFVSDDIGGQNGLLLSPDMWERHLGPRMKRWCRLIHDHGVRVFYHSDGACEAMVGRLIECGIDVLNPIQHVCPGMDPATLKAKYGDRVVFHGGVDNQRVLPFGTPEEVRAEVRMLRDTLGAGGEGFICCSCHNVQAGTPVENILAMIDEAQSG